jgi:hypothetical protein
MPDWLLINDLTPLQRTLLTHRPIQVDPKTDLNILVINRRPLVTFLAQLPSSICSVRAKFYQKRLIFARVTAIFVTVQGQVYIVQVGLTTVYNLTYMTCSRGFGHRAFGHRALGQSGIWSSGIRSVGHLVIGVLVNRAFGHRALGQSGIWSSGIRSVGHLVIGQIASAFWSSGIYQSALWRTPIGCRYESVCWTFSTIIIHPRVSRPCD